MDLETSIISTIDSIYDSALDTKYCDRMLRNLMNLVDGISASIVVSMSRSSTMNVYLNWSEDAIRAYHEKFFRDDPWVPPEGWPEGAVALGQELIPSAEIEKTLYYEEVLKPSGQYDVIGVTVLSSPRSLAGVVAHRSKSQEFFGERERKLFGFLSPHLTRFAKVVNLFNTHSLVNTLFEESLNKINTGMILLDHRQKVVFSNNKALQILRADNLIKESRGKLKLNDPSSQVIFDQSLRNALNPLGACGNQLAFTYNETEILDVQILPLKPYHTELVVLLPAGSLGVLVCLDVRRQDMGSLDGILSSLYNLTPTEASIAKLAASGECISICADKIGMSKGTARWHLKNVYQKMDVTGGQSELVRVLNSANFSN